MRLLSLTLENVRNYQQQETDLGSAMLHLFVGPNGSGKTNFLEALSLLSLTKSCRGSEDQDVTMWSQGHYRVKGTVQPEAHSSESLELVCDRSVKHAKAGFRNDVRVPLTSLVGVLPTVTFLPEDLVLFRGPPEGRRRFLDRLLCQVSPDYLHLLLRYGKVLRQRNALLKRIARVQEAETGLDLWDRELAHAGAIITEARLELLATMNLTFANELTILGIPWSNARIIYERRTHADAAAALKMELSELLRMTRQRDLILQTTGIGPHREDWHIEALGHELTAFASRGQERLVLLALLFIEVSYLELRRGEKPVVLLDDVFSELDDAHRDALLQSLGAYQCFLTTTHLPLLRDGMAVWAVEEGRVYSHPCMSMTTSTKASTSSLPRRRRVRAS